MKKYDISDCWNFYESEECNSYYFTCPDGEIVDLPHDFIIGKPRFKTAPGQNSNGYFGNGQGVYRKTLDIPYEWKDKTVLLEVDGAYMNTELTVNRELMALHPNGYTPFLVDITPALRFDGRKNRLKIITQSRQPSTRWYSGGGLYRSVSLWVGEQVHIKPWDVFVTTTVMTTMLNGIDILLFAILGIGLSSVAHCIKRLAWEENVELSKAIPDGLRQNWKQYGLLGLLVGVGIFIAKYAATAAQGLSGYLPAVILAVVFAPIAAYMSVTITVYDIPFTEQFRYSLLSYAKNIPQTLVAACLCFLPFAGVLAVGMLLGTAFGAIMATTMRLFIPVVMLAWFLFAYTSLDRSINEKYYPELVRRGLDLTHYEEEVNWLDF